MLLLAVFSIGACSDDDDPLRFVRASGNVVDGSGPIEAAVVTIQEWTGTDYANRETQETTVTGAYNIRWELPASQASMGAVRLSVVAAGYLESIVDLQPGDNNGITVTLDPEP